MVNTKRFEEQRDVVRKVKSEARIIVIFQYPRESRTFLITAYDEGMMNGEYALICPNIEIMLATKNSYRPEMDRYIYTGQSMSSSSMCNFLKVMTQTVDLFINSKSHL